MHFFLKFLLKFLRITKIFGKIGDKGLVGGTALSIGGLDRNFWNCRLIWLIMQFLDNLYQKYAFFSKIFLIIFIRN